MYKRTISVKYVWNIGEMHAKIVWILTSHTYIKQILELKYRWNACKNCTNINLPYIYKTNFAVKFEKFFFSSTGLNTFYFWKYVLYTILA